MHAPPLRAPLRRCRRPIRWEAGARLLPTQRVSIRPRRGMLPLPTLVAGWRRLPRLWTLRRLLCGEIVCTSCKAKNSVASVPCGCFLHQTAPRNFLICVKRTADLLAWLAQKAPRKTHSLRAHIAGICCVMLGLGMLICAEQTPHPRPSRALHLLRDMYSQEELKMEN